MNDKPSVVFLIPFASRKVRPNWPTACKYLQQTVRSIRNSVSENYRVVVAGNEEPELKTGFDSRVHFLSLKHSSQLHPNYRVAVRVDKLTKIEAAWRYAKSRWQPKYVMKLDADDFISSRLVGWLDDSAKEAGYLIQDGWLWRSGARYLIHRTEFLDRVCGSCLIIRSDLADRPGPFLTEVEGVVLDEAGSSLASTDHYSLVPGSGHHHTTAQRHSSKVCGAICLLGTHAAHSSVRRCHLRVSSDSVAAITGDRASKFNVRKTLAAIRRTRFITQSLRKEFMLPG